MAVKNRKCLCDGVKYSYCPDCNGADRLAPTWKAEFCSETCMTLWNTCTRYNLGKLTKPEAKSIISALTLKPTEQYASCVQRDLGIILKEEPKPKPKRGKKAELPTLEESTSVEFKVELDAEIKSIENDVVEVEIAVPTVPVAQHHTLEYKIDNTHEVVTETTENE